MHKVLCCDVQPPAAERRCHGRAKVYSHWPFVGRIAGGGGSTCSACSRRLLSSSLDVSVRGRGRGVTAAEMRTVPSTQGQHGHDPHRPSAGHPRPGSRDPRTAIAVSGIARSRTRICVARSFDSSNPYFVIILVYVGAQETGRAFVLRFSPYRVTGRVSLSGYSNSPTHRFRSPLPTLPVLV